MTQNQLLPGCELQIRKVYSQKFTGVKILQTDSSKAVSLTDIEASFPGNATPGSSVCVFVFLSVTEMGDF